MCLKREEECPLDEWLSIADDIIIFLQLMSILFEDSFLQIIFFITKAEGKKCITIRDV